MARRNTRELILKTSLEQFNANGEAEVSTNHIAIEADISPGNLYYHFANKDEIILELFKQFLGRYAPLLEFDDGHAPDLEQLWFRLHLMFELKGEYRFLYRNLTQLTGRNEDIRRAMRALGVRERQAIDDLIQGMEADGVFDITELHREALVDTVMLQINWWIAYAEVLGDPGIDDGRIQSRAIARVLFLFVPFLEDDEANAVRELAGAYLRA